MRKVTKILLLLLVIAALPLFGAQCTRGVSQEAVEANKPVTLRWWRVFDDEETVRPIIEAYKVIHPNVNIEYTKLRYEDYENELLNALAEDRGPDLVSLHNTWIPAYGPKLATMPATVTLPYQETVGGLKKEVVVSLKTKNTLAVRDLKNRFVDVVAKDVITSTADDQGQLQEKIYGLPLSLDTMVLYVNRDLLNLGGVPEVPKTWSEMQKVVTKITRLDSQGKIVQSAAALGTSRNIDRASDILALLMMQNGAQMLGEDGKVAFHLMPLLAENRPIPPGQEALSFYTEFANPQKEVYTWSAENPSSLDAFVRGTTAMFFGYAYHLPTIKARAPRLNLEMAPVPQIEGNPTVNMANYWIEAVSRKSKNQNWAWDFLMFATSAEQAPKYLSAVNRPTALRSLIATQQDSEEVGVFASEALTATSWYRGKNSRAAELVLLDAIDAALAGGEAREILNIAAERINQTLQ